ncbi:MAG: CocE/NonD family hydrolase, partial [Bacteroidota bacterium]
MRTLLLFCALLIGQSTLAQLPIDYSTLAYAPGEPVPFADPKTYLEQREQPYEYEKTTRKSYYLTMRDGVNIAVDVYLPEELEAGQKLPTILYQTRYVRSVELKRLFRPLRKYVTTNVPIEEVYLMNSYGYAVVLVDTRGSGASYGSRDMEFSPNEVQDGAEVCDWIVEQPWSNGKIGASGVSYVATTALALLANQHPAVKAIFPRCGIWDMYADVVFPGGILQGPFVDIWGLTTQSMDANNFKPFGGKVKMAVKGIHPVEGPDGRKQLEAAVKAHENNFDIMSGARKVKYRDDGHDIFRLTLDTCSVHRHLVKINAGKTPIYWLTGWYDGGICRGAPNAYRMIEGPQKMVLGAWDHDPSNMSSPYNGGDFEVKFDVEAEVIRFFDYHLLGIDNGIMDEPPVRYYTCGEERWNFSDTWPPEWTRVKTFYLNADQSLTWTPVPTAARLPYKVDYELGTGKYARYNSQTSLYKHGSTRYEHMDAFAERCLTFTGEALEAPMTITGNAVM